MNDDCMSVESGSSILSAHTVQTVKFNVPRFALVGTRPGLMTSVITTGLIAALRKAGTSVSVLKVGAALSQLTHYRRISGHLSLSLHPGLLQTDTEYWQTLVKASSGVELLIIEADWGLDDTFSYPASVSSVRELCQKLQCPVVLIADGEGYQEGVARVVNGFVGEGHDSRVVGMIAVNSERRTVELQRQAFDHLSQVTGVSLIGILPKSDKPFVQFEKDEESASSMSRTRLLNSLELVQNNLSLDLIREVAARTPVTEIPKSLIASRTGICKIAVADDGSMNQTFQENLNLLRCEGAELIAFSPLSDSKVPAHVRGVYLPGGRLERYTQILSANTAMRESLRQFVLEGGLLYCEGSSLGYLFSSVSMPDGESCPMLGIIKGTATFLEDELSYENLVFSCRAIAPNYLLKKDEILRGLRLSRWAYRVEEQVQAAFVAFTPEQLLFNEEALQEDPPIPDGFLPRQNILGTAFHLNWATNAQVAERFVRFAHGSPTVLPTY